MDAAIAAAERDAQLASSKANTAAKQLVDWTEGEKSVIKNLKKLGAVIASDAFQQVNSAFVQQHRSVFEFTDENKFEYTALHEQYVELMEKTLVDLAKDVNMDELLSNLPGFMEARAHTEDPEGTGAYIDFLLSLTDFETFKNLMLMANMATTSRPVVAVVADSDAPLQTLDRTALPKVMVEQARALMQLSAEGASVEWKQAVLKKDEMLLETTTLNGVRYARLSMLIDLSVPHAVTCMIDMSVPDRSRWNQMADRVEVHRDERAGKVHDVVCTLHFKMPGVAKLIKSIPSKMTFRIAIEEDAPKPGSVSYVMTGWDLKSDAPDTSSMSMLRVATLEPAGEGVCRVQTIDQQMQAVPEWLSNMWMSNTFAKQVKADMMRYKKHVGLK
ncbi:hypothetical protein KFE25_010249 [Diacronema lutheri]|uniref:ADP-ribosylation factor-like protein 2-binding protein n=1 Tax=Diacronema lutheri TaxID=2081491 RepID=A0A8J5XGQ2_DIALT|nr:hypothetical protein KFE25_010249 [Diacronema lutheri]